MLTATPNHPGPARNLFRFRDQECSDFVITNTVGFDLHTESVRNRISEPVVLIQGRGCNWRSRES